MILKVFADLNDPKSLSRYLDYKTVNIVSSVEVFKTHLLLDTFLYNVLKGTAAGGWAGGAPEVPSNPYGSMILQLVKASACPRKGIFPPESEQVRVFT